MLSLPVAATIHLTSEVTTLAVCWRVTRRDAQVILGTQHDEDLFVAVNTTDFDLSGAYIARAGITGSSVSGTSDMSVDNMEVDGALNSSDLTFVDLSAADIEAGLFDGAEIKLFLVNWEDPDQFQIILRSGTLGEIFRTSEGRYRTELRGLAQQLTQNIVRTYGSSCDAELGDARCSVDVGALTLTGTVTAATSNRQFSASIFYGSPVAEEGYFNGGLITWTSGENANFSMEVKLDAYGSPAEILLYLPMPKDIAPGDAFTIRPGCDKSAAMCKGRFANLVNFRGHGAWVPGMGEVMAFGGQTAERKPRATGFLEWPRGAEYEEP